MENDNEYEKLVVQINKLKDDRIQQQLEDENDELISRLNPLKPVETDLENEQDELISGLSRLPPVELKDEDFQEPEMDEDLEFFQELDMDEFFSKQEEQILEKQEQAELDELFKVWG